MDEEVEMEEEILSGESSGKYTKLLESDSRKFKLSGMFKDWFLDYASYVILYRAVPHIVDGLKPVQRRVLHAMHKIDDGAYTKVANVVGSAMQYHPHGDASILGALVQLGQKGYCIDCQGNWGNILTGDSNAAARYIEARLSKFAKEVIFDDKITNWMSSYDGRNKEPVELPVRFPLLLAQGTEGIAVGMASKILPHNFNELLDASIAILEGREFELYPDFPTGGLADCSKYLRGRRGGSVKVRARIEKIDRSTISITELPYGRTAPMLIDSILKAKDKGKIKIKKIEDMTTDKVEILIHLPGDVSPDKTIDALYAFTDCEFNISPNACVIKESKPQFLDVNEILIYDTLHTKDLLEQELRLRMDELENEWHNTSLERIFFENKVYMILQQNQRTWEDQKNDILATMKTYERLLRREITMKDIDWLIDKPVRKISKFDIKAIDEKVKGIEDEMSQVQDNIDHIVRYTIDWFGSIKARYGKDYPRRTEISSFETIAVTKVVSNNAKLYANMAEGFVGMNLKKEDGVELIGECSDLSEVIVFNRNGQYKVTKISEKEFFWKDLLYVGVFTRNDSRTVFNAIYRDGISAVSYAKRFTVTAVTRDKVYDLTQGKEGSKVQWFTVNHNGEGEVVKLFFRPRTKLKKLTAEYDFSALAIKGRTSRGNLVSKNPIQKILLKTKGVSTISGKDIWYDADIQKLNDEGRGLYLGQFNTGDKVLAVFRNGTFYTTSFDVSNRYQGDVLLIEKLNTDKTFTALYFEGDPKVRTFYVKRFSFYASENTPVCFISENRNSYLVELSADRHPQFRVSFAGKNEGRTPEDVDAEEFIAKKSLAAKGKRCHSLEIGKVEFIEPLVKEGDDEEEAMDLGDIDEEFNAPDPGRVPDVDEEDMEPTLF